MRVAFSIWRERIAPVFDTASDFLIAERVEGELVKQSLCSLPEEQRGSVAKWLVAQGVEAVVCGALSCYRQADLEAQGMKIYPFIAGEIAAIQAAWLENRLASATFTMPGCGRRGGRGRCGGGRGRQRGVRHCLRDNINS